MDGGQERAVTDRTGTDQGTGDRMGIADRGDHADADGEHQHQGYRAPLAEGRCADGTQAASS